MPTGTITSVGARYSVRPDGEGKPVEFTLDLWPRAAGGPPELGDRVEYEPGGNARRAASVRLMERARSTPAGPPPPPPVPARTYDRPRAWRPGEAFLNPYNFVRPLTTVAPDGETRADVLLLGRREPPPLDRYVGLTGKLTCTLEAVSPVFVSDSYEVDGEPDEHRSFRFLRLPVGPGGEEVPCIPASSLRGVVRSVFEAVTSSCWEHVADRRLSRRLVTDDAKNLVPARLSLAEGKWRVELFTGTAGYCPGGPMQANRSMYAGWVLHHLPRAGTRTAPRLPAWVRHGSECWARMRRSTHRRGFRFWNVEALGTREEVSRGYEDPPEDVVIRSGLYFSTDKNIRHKHDERFFFSDDAGDFLEVREECVARYVELLEDYRENFREGRNEPEQGVRPSRFVRESRPSRAEECEEELVYAWVIGSGDERMVRALAPVSVPRLFYDHTVHDRFPAFESVRPCSHVNREAEFSLCPACRVFGWVSGEKTVEGRPAAYRSRVRFGDALFGEEWLDRTPHVLDILSAPKPTTVRFYLIRRDGDLRPSRRESEVDYDSEAMVLRGRKFYRGRARARMSTREPATGQNRTLRDHLQPGASGTFEVRFENLAPVELGALLWSLELEEGCVHRLGFGKPLGMGAVRMRVESLSFDTAERYADGGDGAQARDARRDVERLKAGFRKAMEARHGEPFSKLENVADLRALLDGSPPRLEVTYPTLRDDANPESFHWFVANKGRSYGERGPGQGHWLDLAHEDHGLPFDPSRHG